MARATTQPTLLRLEGTPAEYEKQLYGVITGSLDRARNAAAVVGTTSAAIAALYTGTLGLVFSSGGEAFPLRGLLTPVFLGVGIVLAAYYIAFATPGRSAKVALPINRIDSLADDLTLFVDSVTRRRAWALRSAVFSLALGVAFISLPFISSATFTDASKSTAPPSSAPISSPSVVASALPLPDYTSGPVELEKIRYQAQIDTFLKSQTQTAESSQASGFVESTAFFTSALGWGTVFIAFGPLVIELVTAALSGITWAATSLATRLRPPP